MTKTMARRLFAYDHWANRRVAEALLAWPALDAEAPAARLLSHLLAAEELWLLRVKAGPYQGRDFWPATPPAQWRRLLDALHTSWLDLFDTSSFDLARVISYTNSKGTPYETALSDIVQHLVIHGQHHRAQIAVHLRASGVAPPPTDFIYFTRDPASGDASGEAGRSGGGTSGRR